MRDFHPELAAALARRDGSAPAWLLCFTAFGTDYILCQDAITITPWGKTALPWIASWGQLTEGVTSTLADFNISNLAIDLINDPLATPNLRTLAKSRALNGIAMSVYLWVDGCTAQPHEMNSFVVTGIDLPDESSVNIELQDQSSKYENFYPGTVVTKEAYPEADPDDVGKTIPMPLGTVSKLVTLALDCGRVTNIPNAISATTETIPVSDPSGLATGMLLQVDEEIISVTSITSSTLTVTRGVSATLAATHQRGAAIWEVKDQFVYVVADYPVTSMFKAYARIGQVTMDISPICTTWPDGSHPLYPGKAVISVPGYITVQQAIDLVVNDLITVNNGTLDTNIVGAVTKTGNAYLTGNIASGSFPSLTGNIASGSFPSLTGNIASGSFPSLTGNITSGSFPSLTGDIASGSFPSLTGNINPGNILSVAGLINHTGSIVLNGNLSDPGHSHNAAISTNENTISQLPSAGSVFQDGLYNLYLPTHVAMSFPTNGARTSVSYSFTVMPHYTSGNTVNVRVYVNSSIYYSNSYTWVSGSPFAFSFTVSGDIRVETVDITATGAGGSGNFNVTGASRIIQLSANQSSSNMTNINTSQLGVDTAALQITPSSLTTTTNSGAFNGDLGITGGSLPTKGELGITGGSLPTKGDLGVTGGSLPTNGNLDVTGGSLPTNGSLDVTGGSLPANGNLAATDNISVDQSTLDSIISGLVSKTGTVTLTGNSVANTLIGDAILVDVISPITAPQDVITKILGTPCNLVGTFPAGYTFNGAITSSKRAPEWCHGLARQCRSYFKWILGAPTLIVRPDVLAPVKSINEIRLSNGMLAHGQKLTDINDVINTINLRYDRDWSSTSSGDEVYRQVAKDLTPAARAESIATYGVRERPELFRFDFVTNPTMAESLVAFYLSWYAWQRWQHTQEVYLFEAALEFADAVTLAFLENEIGECTEVGFSPGNGRNIDKIQLTVIE